MSHFGSKQHLQQNKERIARNASFVLSFIKDYHKKHGYAPNHKEIQDGCEISYIYVGKLLECLVDNNFIEYGGGSRMIKIL